MERERWAKVEQLLQATLDQPAHLRETYLATACGTDRSLLNEVQSFLGPNDESPSFLDDDAITVAARSLATEKASIVGTTIGPYRVLGVIGAGGMGEVFLALDTRLNRQIALKILPPEFATNPDRLQRFEQEARAASALNHPNVLVVHDAGVFNGIPYIASEFLRGETLRERLNTAPISVSKALGFAGQIARALAAAHENSIVHRDLKPENIFVTDEGRIKILDFGLAKPFDQVREKGAVLTTPGMIMGSIGYLSPEQVRGQAASQTSDIFSFGCVFYEMLTGKRAFSKDSNAETMAAILHEEPAETSSLSQLPSAVSQILRRCLEKSSTERFYSARDLAFALESCQTVSTAPSLPAAKHPARLWWTLGLVALLAFIAQLVFFKRSSEEPVPIRFQIPIPGEPVTGSPAVSISPNGRYLAFMAMGSAGKPIIWLRPMNEIAPRPVEGSEDARYPFWSADSRLLAFHVGDKLKSIDISTGVQHTIATIRGIINGAWNKDGTILLGIGNGPLLRVKPDGSKPSPVTTLDAASSQRSHWWPAFLPDNRHFLYTVNASHLKQSGVYVASLDNSAAKLLVPNVITNAQYVQPGLLLYSRDGLLLARPFDAGSLAFRGDEFPVVEKLKSYYGYTAFSASQTGTLAFRAGDQARYTLAWFDRTGRNLGPITEDTERKWSEGVLPLVPTLSPDGSMLSTIQYQPSNGAYGIWVSALNRANLAFPVTEARNSEGAVWSPDGSQIAYSASPHGGFRDIFVKRLNEEGTGKLLAHAGGDAWPLDWSADGRLLLYLVDDGQSRTTLWMISLDSVSPPSRVPGAPSDVTTAKLSPDGRWLACSSAQSGSSMIYVQDFPKGDSRVPISGRGATDPEWRRDGRELFFLSPQSELMSVEVNSAAGFSASTPKLLFKTPGAGVSPYTVTADGKRFLVQIPREDITPPIITVTLNWPSSLREVNRQ